MPTAFNFGHWFLALLLLSPFFILILDFFVAPVWSSSSTFPGLNDQARSGLITRAVEVFSLSWARVSGEGLFWVFGFTVAQALLSAAVSLALGLLAAYGLLSAQNFFSHQFSFQKSQRLSQALEAFALLPNLAPVLLLILASMKFLPRMSGMTGIVILHTLLNLGLVAVSVSRLIRIRMARMTDLAYLEGCTRWTYFHRVLLPNLSSDLLSLGLFVFTICFSSFAIPLIIGGSQGVTVEVLIYNLLRFSGDPLAPLILAALQMISVIALAVLIPKPRSPQEEAVGRSAISLSNSQSLVSFSPGLLILLLPPVLIILSLFDSLVSGWSQFLALKPLHEELLQQAMGSLFVATLTALILSLLMMQFAWVRPSGRWQRFFLGYAAPSSALTGLSLLIFWRATGLASLVKISLALALIFAPAFYRMQWDALLNGLRRQVRIAETLGATRAMIFWDVMMPQLFAPLGALAGLASLWAWGDFAISSVIGERALTLGMTAQTLMDSYRLDVATIYVWMIAAGGLISYAVFKGVGRVLGSKSSL